MKAALLALVLISGLSQMASATTYLQEVKGDVTVWNNESSTIATTVYIRGAAAQELFENMQATTVPMSDESGRAYASMKTGSAIVCVKSSDYQCNIYLDGTTGSLRK